MSRPVQDPLIQAACGAVKAGRIGLPWNIQVDYLLAGAGDGDRLWDSTATPLSDVLDLLGQPVHRVYARVGSWQHGAEDSVTLFLDHQHGVTSTIMVGLTGPLAGVEVGGPAVHRYRLSGSQGVLDLDLLRPGVTVRTADQVRQQPVGAEPEAAPDGAAPATKDDDDRLEPILQAAREAAAAGRPMEVAG